jgi:hypothetical protein
MLMEERMMKAARLRLRLQMNNRLRLESMAALSRVFREYQEPLDDELLAALVLAVPEELLGEMEGNEVRGPQAVAMGRPRDPDFPGRPHEPGKPRREPGRPHEPGRPRHEPGRPRDPDEPCPEPGKPRHIEPGRPRHIEAGKPRDLEPGKPRVTSAKR